MDYSKTVNLPQTDFPMKANLPQREPALIAGWEKNSVYQKMQKKNKNKEKFILHDGPPYANGKIHLGTALNKILKDFVVKYKSMSGFGSPFTPGWDCHGLPIEQQCLKELKLDKHKVSRLEFRHKAAEFASRFIDIQRNEFKRLGVFADWANPYLTLDPKYEAEIIRVFGGLVKNGFIFRQKKPVYWCPTCETALADAEVEYAEHISHSIFVKFEVLEFPKGLEHLKNRNGKISALIWTTTPWTLPANVALAFKPSADYVLAKFELDGARQEHLILADSLIPAVSQKIKAIKYDIEEKFSGRLLEGIKCKNPVLERDSVGVLADFVSMEEGTGIVHIAPGHGQEDYQAGLKYNLPVLSPVDDRGIFTEEAKQFHGHKVFAANPLIVEKLKTDNLLIFDEQISHSYPHCWRCKRAIIFRATPQWFLSIEHNNLRGRMLEAIRKVEWIPGYGQNRIAGMVEVRPDWCLSRQRLWGVPIPVFYCVKCGEPLLDTKVIERISEVFAKFGSNVWFKKTPEELASPLALKCKKCGETSFRKEEDILDVWFDSGVSCEAVLASGNFPELSWPADMYLEGSDQHRGWFQTSLIPEAALRHNAPYKTVLTHGFVVDGEGKKMSKSLGNVIAPQEIIEKYGADILRLWTATSDYREDIRISPEIIKGLVDAYRKIRNTLRFLLGNIYDFSADKKLPYSKLREIDRYALHRLEDLKQQVSGAYGSYEFHRAAGAISNFCSVFLSGFYLDLLKDTLYCDAPGWESRQSAQTVLLEIFSSLTIMLAPVLSFTSEEAWQELRKKDNNCPESVFLCGFPEQKKERLFNDELKSKWDKLLLTRDKALLEFERLRKDKKIGSNMDAHLDLRLDAKISPEYKELLCAVLGVWDINVSFVSDPGAGRNQIEVSADVSGHKKCDRCWRHIEDVNAENLCGRCVKALAE